MFDADAIGWATMPFSEAVEINPRRALPKSGDVPFLDMASLPLNGAPVSVVERRPVSAGGSRFRAGDTLFARITPCAENGKLGFIEAVAGGAIAQGSTEFIVMSARDGITSPDYIRFLAGWAHVRDQAIGLMEGTSGRQRVPGWAFDEIEVPVPPLDEQRRIAEVLRSVDEAIRTSAEVARRARNTFNRLIDALHEENADNTVPLRDFCVPKGLQTGPFGSQLKVSDYVDGGVPVLMPTDLRPDGVDFVGAKATSYEKFSQLKQHALQPGDLLFSRRGDVEKCGVYLEGDPVAMCGTGCLRARIDRNRADPVLIYFLVQSQRCGSWLRQHAVGVTMPNLNTSIIGALPVPNLPMAAQEQWVEGLLIAEGVSRANERHLIELARVKTTITSDLLSGRARVAA